eukprot:3382013-Ditylum_brightwellii.AAC.1
MEERVIFNIKDCVKAVIDEFQKNLKKESPALAALYLFVIMNDGCDKLSEEEGHIYHTTSAKLLLVCNRGRSGIMKTVAFLIPKVKEPDCDNEKKLV